MALIVHIETATKICSVSLSQNSEIIAFRESNIVNSHSSLITNFVDAVFKETGKTLNELDAVSVSMGPGSYTGLRIGVSTAKGLCYSLEKPLISVNTLQAMANGFINNGKFENALFCPMIDARRMEVYCGFFDNQLKTIIPITAEIIDENSFDELLKENTIYFFGDGAEKCKSALSQQKNAFFDGDFNTSSKYLISLAEEKFRNKEFENTAYFEPFYLKDFIAGKPKVKGL
ncbi:MAG: tRNA (adenosine(37)-N6)-threonylcarbamoyltransferase complex dimerization subunit type 1 TsaB [Bacteroidetes bacterium]|nr:tRNA (adenosine(37)-N6)-threonylcarbamoyltransferase complex dimerization subunit type 1 TsaB [Bacteroidota bacterium]